VHETEFWQHPGIAPQSAAADIRSILAAGGPAPWDIFRQVAALSEWGCGRELGFSGGTAGVRRIPGLEHEVVIDFLRGASGQIFAIDVIPIVADPLMASWMHDAEE